MRQHARCARSAQCEVLLTQCSQLLDTGVLGLYHEFPCVNSAFRAYKKMGASGAIEQYICCVHDQDDEPMAWVVGVLL